MPTLADKAEKFLATKTGRAWRSRLGIFICEPRRLQAAKPGAWPEWTTWNFDHSEDWKRGAASLEYVEAFVAAITPQRSTEARRIILVRVRAFLRWLDVEDDVIEATFPKDRRPRGRPSKKAKLPKLKPTKVRPPR